MTFYTSVKKYAKKATKSAGKRYGVSYGRRGLRMSKNSLSRIDKDVQMIKSRLNVEKKFKDGSLTTGFAGQVDGNGAGYFTSTLTPLISLGTTENERVGGSIKLTGLHVQLQAQGQSETYSKRKMKICVVSSTDSSVTNVINDMWDANPLTGLVDFHSNRNYSNNPRAHKLLRTIYSGTPQKQIVSGSNVASTGQDIKFGIKMQQLTRFEGSSTTPKDMNYFLIIFVNDGNVSTGTGSSNTGVLTPSTSTGILIQEYFRWWYVDN